MSNHPPLPPAPAADDGQSQIILDAQSRLVQFSMRRPLDIEPVLFTVPFAMIKSLAGQIIIAEAGAEQQERLEGQKNGILRLAH